MNLELAMKWKSFDTVQAFEFVVRMSVNIHVLCQSIWGLVRFFAQFAL